MNDAGLYRLGAIAFGLSGFVNIFADFVPGTDWLNLAGVALGILGLPAIYLIQRDEMKGFGTAAFVCAALGLIGIAGFLFTNAAIFPQLTPEVVEELTNSQGGFAIFIAVIVYVLGVVLFSVAGWLANILPRPAWLFWVIGTAPTVVAIALPTWAMTIAEIIAGAGVMWLAWGVIDRFRAGNSTNSDSR